MVNAKELISVTLVLFSVIDILGSTPIIIDLLKKGIKIEAAKLPLLLYCS
jgi:multiple antibiotic resistance protein